MNIATAVITAKQIQASLNGKKIVDVVANQNPHTFVWFALDPSQAYQNDAVADQYPKYLIGKKIHDCRVNLGGYGLYDFIYLGKKALMSDIVPRYLLPSQKLPKKHQLLLIFDDHSRLCFGASLGGALFLFDVDENGLPRNYKNEFPSILSKSFSSKFFIDLIKKTELRSMSVKQFLVTKNRIPGLDNSILQEILWEAEVNPMSKMVNLNEDEYLRIFDALKRVSNQIIQAGGKDIDKDIYGNVGAYVTKASRNTVGTPCARCSGTIVKKAYLGGSVYYCSDCQVLK